MKIKKSNVVGTFFVLAIAFAYIFAIEGQRPTVEQIVKAAHAEEQETQIEEKFVKKCQSLEEDDILISEHGRVFYVYGNWPGAVGTKSLSMSPSAETNSYEQFYQIYGSCRVVEAGSEEWVKIMRETF